jgi:predicted RND superfamily exporter protein
MDEYFFDKPESEDELAKLIDDQTRLLEDYIAENGLQRPQTFDELIDLKIAKMQFDIKDTPFLNERIASDDGTALAIYIPITSKKVAYPVSNAVFEIIEKHKLEGQEFHVAGLPIAEETFGHEMFIQMAVVAPLAFLLIMLIVYLLFRQPMFLIPVGVTAALSVIWAMGLLIGFGYTVHIMSSMIPVFLLPIAILNSVHILSQFYDRFSKTHKKEESLLWAMKRLYLPMVFTSLTSAVGFASLAMADIPPVQVFGLFVSFGILVAWFFSITLVPAMVNLLSEEKLTKSISKDDGGKRTILDRILRPVGKLTHGAPATVLIAAVILTALGVWGILQIQVNDNPVKWFKEGHPIREADVAMNEKFGGTYMTNLVITGDQVPEKDEQFIAMLENADYPNLLNNPEVSKYISNLQYALEEHPLVGKASSVFDGAKRVRYVLQGEAQEGLTREQKKEQYYAIALPEDLVDVKQAKLELFYEYLDNLSDEELEAYEAQFDENPDWTDADTPQFKNFNPGADALKAAEGGAGQQAYELMNELVAQFDNDPRTYRDMQKLLVRNTRELEDYSAGSKLQPVWEKANVWLQLKSGDNQSMKAVMKFLDEYLAENPAPEGVEITWTGLTYINKVWQDLMVNGMLFAIIGSFGIVFVLMLVEFRNIVLGILSMIPLTIALVLSYGLMGWIGKDYDMPIAVCSSLSLGLAVDFAIHFLQRFKNHFKETGDVKETIEHMFQEPGRAILRNAIVISLGFLPLMVSSLTPYMTVGMFFSLLMVMATLATIFILPAAMKYLAPFVFRKFFKTTGE